MIIIIMMITTAMISVNCQICDTWYDRGIFTQVIQLIYQSHKDRVIKSSNPSHLTKTICIQAVNVTVICYLCAYIS